MSDNRVIIFSAVIVISLLFSGCATEYNRATNREEFIFYSTDREIRLGESIARQIEKNYKIEEDKILQAHIDEIGQKLASICDRQDITYHFVVLSDKEVNAISLPGGYIYINKGLLDIAETDDEIACVLSHEIGHIAARHSVKKYQGLLGYSLARILIAKTNEIALKRGSDIVFGHMLLAYGREDELLADRLAVRYARRAGYDPKAMLSFLEKLRDIEYKRPLRPLNYLKTHPSISDRIRVVREEIFGQIDFVGYINR